MLQAALQSQDCQLYTTAANQKKDHEIHISKLYLSKTKPAPIISTICGKHDRMRTCGRLDERDYFQTCRKETLSRILCLHHYLPTSPRAEPVMLKIEYERTRSSFWAQASLGCPLMPSLGARPRSFALSRLPHRLFSFSETLKKTKLLFTVRTNLDSGIVTLAARAGLSCSVER